MIAPDQFCSVRIPTSRRDRFETIFQMNGTVIYAYVASYQFVGSLFFFVHSLIYTLELLISGYLYRNVVVSIYVGCDDIIVDMRRRTVSAESSD